MIWFCFYCLFSPCNFSPTTKKDDDIFALIHLLEFIGLWSVSRIWITYTVIWVGATWDSSNSILESGSGNIIYKAIFFASNYMAKINSQCFWIIFTSIVFIFLRSMLKTKIFDVEKSMRSPPKCLMYTAELFVSSRTIYEWRVLKPMIYIDPCTDINMQFWENNFCVTKVPWIVKYATELRTSCVSGLPIIITTI